MPKLAFTLVNLAALTLISFFSVDIFYRVITERLEQGDKQKIITEQVTEIKKQTRPVLSHYQVISDRALFGVLEKTDVEGKKEDIEALEPTSLNLALLGTVEGDENTGWAVIIDKSNRKQDIYRTGDSVQEAVIKKIVRNRVVLRVGERDEVLTIEEGAGRADTLGLSRPALAVAAPGIGSQARTVTLRRSDIDESLQDINKILSQARIRPHFNSHSQPDGLIITGIRGDSIFRRMGLRNGDIIRGVDGRPITNPDDIISMYSDLTSASDLALQILRRGREETINYSFR